MIGRRLGEFVVREPLSSGGFGAVFRAEQPALAREAVIKVLHQKLLGSETVVQRFLLEARLASRLDHPFAAHTYAFGAEPDGVLWIAMELVRGTPLDKLLEAHGPLPLERFVPLLERICEVVHTAHEQGIVHRDLKPGNVMVLSRAGPGDMGDKKSNRRLSINRETLRHLSAEQLQGVAGGGTIVRRTYTCADTYGCGKADTFKCCPTDDCDAM